MKLYTYAEIKQWVLTRTTLIQQLETAQSEASDLEELCRDASTQLKQATLERQLCQAQLDCVALPSEIERALEKKNSIEAELIVLNKELLNINSSMQALLIDMNRTQSQIDQQMEWHQTEIRISKTIATHQATLDHCQQRINLIPIEIDNLKKDLSSVSFPYQQQHHAHYSHKHYCFDQTMHINKKIIELRQEKEDLISSSSQIRLSIQSEEEKKRELITRRSTEPLLSALQSLVGKQKAQLDDWDEKKSTQKKHEVLFTEASLEHERLHQKLQEATALIETTDRLLDDPLILKKLLSNTIEIETAYRAAFKLKEAALVKIQHAIQKHQRDLENSHNNRFILNFINYPKEMYHQLYETISRCLVLYEQEYPYQQSIKTRLVLANLPHLSTYIHIQLPIDQQLGVLYGLVWDAIQQLETSSEDKRLHDALLSCLGIEALDKTNAIAYYLAHQKGALPWREIQLCQTERFQYQKTYDEFNGVISKTAPQGQTEFYHQGTRLLKAIKQREKDQRFDYKYYSNLLESASAYIASPKNPQSFRKFESLIDANSADKTHKGKLVVAAALILLGIGLVATGVSMAFLFPYIFLGAPLICLGLLCITTNIEKGPVKEGHALEKARSKLSFFPAEIVMPVPHNDPWDPLPSV